MATNQLLIFGKAGINFYFSSELVGISIFDQLI